MVQEKKDRISIANILALIGLAGLGVITFFGIYIHSVDGSMGGAAVGTLALVAGLCLLLWLGVKAKSADNNFDKWKFVEWGSIAAYVIVAILCATPFQRFFYVLTEKGSLQQQAQTEVNAIETLYSGYNKQQKLAWVNAEQQLINYAVQSMQYKTDKNEDALKGYFIKKIKVTNDLKADIKSWRKKAELLTQYNDAEINDVKRAIETWDLMSISRAASQLARKDSTAWSELDNHIKKFTDQQLIPIIEYDKNSKRYQLAGYATFDLGTPPQAKFADMLHNTNGNTALGWVLYIVLHLLVLLTYVATPRNPFVGPERGTNIGGADLS